ncbi:alpha/beta hydrolase [Streptomyces sp. HB132]|uniref:alpha/beta hydrolase n=1 Tax=Streptomyces sp. HB132 TaxID=767388 RepID=UPI00195F4BEB|nr:alpha/beta hydrolase [Streptomyces sp. HB132]MBM7439923.1 alpha-beta hydrolase superfamily lysophospholipase [Streptomyces sp. HB132]
MTEYDDHYAPEGLSTRGTVVVVPGRGETRATYTRFGRRLASDAYRVRIVDAPDLDGGDLAGSLTRFGEQLAAAAEDSATGEDGAVRPLVLVGADSGAVAVAALLGRDGVPSAARPDAVVLAGVPGGGATAVGGWADELDVRTACPVHRGTLTEDDGIRRGALEEEVPQALLTAAYDSALDVPALFLLGDADPLADREALVRTAKSLPRARLSVVRDAHHDVLNDMQHRSVAAEAVTFLETLRNGLVPVLTVESSTW